MRSILIVSPEPESARMLSLAFELDGWTAHEATSVEDARGIKDANTVIIDAIEGASELKKTEQWKSLAHACGTVGRPIVILPRGMEEAEARRKIGDACLLVRRPYELIHLVKLADDQAATTRAAGKSASAGKAKIATKRAAPKKRPTRRRA
ncbi:MAG: hypothetical protein WC690_08750 [bacterium]